MFEPLGLLRAPGAEVIVFQAKLSENRAFWADTFFFSIDAHETLSIGAEEYLFRLIRAAVIRRATGAVTRPLQFPDLRGQLVGGHLHHRMHYLFKPVHPVFTLPSNTASGYLELSQISRTLQDGSLSGNYLKIRKMRQWRFPVLGRKTSLSGKTVEWSCMRPEDPEKRSGIPPPPHQGPGYHRCKCTRCGFEMKQPPESPCYLVRCPRCEGPMVDG